MRSLGIALLVVAALVIGCSAGEILDAAGIEHEVYGYAGMFHLGGCQAIADIPTSNLQKFANRDGAIAAGLAPCPTCHP